MGKSVTAQALANQGGARPGLGGQGLGGQGLGGQGLGNQVLDQASVALPLAPGGRGRRAAASFETATVNTATVKTAAGTSAALKAPTAKAVAENAKGAASKAGALKGGAARASGGLKTAKTVQARADQARTERRRMAEQSDVLVSAVISTYLLTHLHHVLQRAEFGAQQEGRAATAANYAQLRKVLCLDARTMEDASASGQPEDAPQAA